MVLGPIAWKKNNRSYHVSDVITLHVLKEVPASVLENGILNFIQDDFKF